MHVKQWLPRADALLRTSDFHHRIWACGNSINGALPAGGGACIGIRIDLATEVIDDDRDVGKSARELSEGWQALEIGRVVIETQLVLGEHCKAVEEFLVQVAWERTSYATKIGRCGHMPLQYFLDGIAESDVCGTEDAGS